MYYYSFCDVFGLGACRWQAIEDEDGIQYGPFPVPKRGLPIRVAPRPKQKFAKSD